MISRATVQTRREPLAEAMIGLTAIFGGVLLIIPGFLTDMVGLAFALPGLRNLTAGWLHTRLKDRAEFQAAGGQTAPPHSQPPRDPIVIEGDYTVVDEPANQSDGDTGTKPRPRE